MGSGFKKYNGDGCCHVIKDGGFQHLENNHHREKCKNKAEWVIGNGRLRCQYHFDKWRGNNA